MRLLITGGSGQLGTDLVAVARAAGHDVTAPSSDEMDLRQGDAVLAAVSAAAPEVIVHAAAFTAVDRCETEVELAEAINVGGTGHIVDAARSVGARVLYVSTDYVFDGTKPEAYLETDPTNPKSVYGRTKLEGESRLGPEDTAVRTSWVVGAHGNNMVKTILRLAGQHPELSFVSDQRGHPTFTADLAQLLCHLAADPLPGVVHATNQGAVSWFEFAQAVLEAAGEDPQRVKPVTTAELTPPRPAPRPENSVLDNAALRNAGRPLLGDFRESLGPVVKTLLGEQCQE